MYRIVIENMIDGEYYKLTKEDEIMDEAEKKLKELIEWLDNVVKNAKIDIESSERNLERAKYELNRVKPKLIQLEFDFGGNENVGERKEKDDEDLWIYE